MKMDWYTKIILTAICALLGILILGRIDISSEARAQAPTAGAFDSVEFISQGSDGFVLFDRRTGKFSSYYRDSGGWQRHPGGNIEKVGADVQKLP